MTREEIIKRLKEIDIRDALQEDYDALYTAIEALEQEPKWTPVSKKLPDKEGQYLVTVQSLMGVNSMELANFSLDLSNVSRLFSREKGRSGWWGCDDGGWNTYIYFGVIAWMPLPESYRLQEPKTEKVFKMRRPTPEERDSVEKYVKSISKTTGGITEW